MHTGITATAVKEECTYIYDEMDSFGVSNIEL